MALAQNSAALTFGPCTTTAWGTLTHATIRHGSVILGIKEITQIGADALDIQVGDSFTLPADMIDLTFPRGDLTAEGIADIVNDFFTGEALTVSLHTGAKGNGTEREVPNGRGYGRGNIAANGFAVTE